MRREQFRLSRSILRGLVSAGAMLLFLAWTCVLPAQAQGPSPVVQALESLEQALQGEQGLNSETKKALTDLVRALKAERQSGRASVPVLDSAAVAGAVDEYLEEWESNREKPKLEQLMDRLSISGDFRLRHESDYNLDSRKDRNRERVRFRVGAKYAVTDRLELGVRLITGSIGDPNSPHHTFGMVYDSLAVSLDRVYLKYGPPKATGLTLTAGKFGHPFYSNPVYSELVWDADVQPEGLVLTYRLTDKGRLEKFELIAGQYILLHQGGADDAFVGVFQASSKVRLTDSLKMNLAVGYYHYSDATPDGSPTIFTFDNAGNRVIDRNFDGITDDFKSDFGILNPIVALTYTGWKYPLTLSGEYIRNLRARDEGSKGWALGAALGSQKKKGDWRLYYQWQVVERDAVFSAVAQDDFLFSTNHRSHVFGTQYKFTDKVQAHLWTLVSQRDRAFSFFTGGSDRDQWRTRLDLNIKF